MSIASPPNDFETLEKRSLELKGKSIQFIADKLNSPIPKSQLNAKGWVGQLIELYLGATSSNQPKPDFPNLGIELKTIPINLNHQPIESTYVCTVQSNLKALVWQDSWVYKKLQHVLWIPIISNPKIPLKERTLSSPFFWHPNSASEQILRQDWEELMEMFQCGYDQQINASYGTYLHIRPKAANSRVLTDYIDSEGYPNKTVPKGFYLRTTFTQKILAGSI